MDTNKIDMYVMTNAKYFPSEKIPYLKEKLYGIDDQKFMMLSTIDLKDPTTLPVDLHFPGQPGDRPFHAGDIGMVC